MNLKIKYRESFRPFAPSVLAEDAKAYFDLKSDSPYMLIVAPVISDLHLEIPKNYYELPIMDRLYVERSKLPSITHIDFSLEGEANGRQEPSDGRAPESQEKNQNGSSGAQAVRSRR